jgi:hypothetical protein
VYTLDHAGVHLTHSEAYFTGMYPNNVYLVGVYLLSDKWMSFESLAKAALKTGAWIAATLQSMDGISKETHQHDEDQGTFYQIRGWQLWE